MFYVLLQVNAPEQQPNPLISFLPFIFLILILYFLMIRPQQKRQKEHQKLIENLQTGDKVITTGGLIGKITDIKKDKDIVVLKVDESSNTKVEVRRIAIAGLWQDMPVKNEPVK